MRFFSLAFLIPALITLPLLAVTTSASAQFEMSPINQCYVPRSACYLGLGFGYNSVNFGNQDIIAIGTSDVIQGGSTIATGFAQGPDDATGGTPIYMDTEFNLAPSIELGYFRHFERSESLLWGFKFTNDYFGTSSNARLIRLPQVGEFTYASDPGNPVPFTGNAVAASTKNQLVDQLAFRPYLGHSFDTGFIYFGGGPTVSKVRNEILDLVGFADINGTRGDISGAPQSFSDSSWVWGGSIEGGVTHFLSRSWFVECNYVWGATANQTFNYSSSFSNADGNQTKSGTLVGSSKWQTIHQSIGVKLCRAF